MDCDVYNVQWCKNSMSRNETKAPSSELGMQLWPELAGKKDMEKLHVAPCFWQLLQDGLDSSHCDIRGGLDLYVKARDQEVLIW